MPVRMAPVADRRRHASNPVTGTSDVITPQRTSAARPLPPALLERMGYPPVRLHHKPEVGIQGVPVPGASPIRCPFLALGVGQPVWPLDPPRVAEFKDGVSAIANVV